MQRQLTATDEKEELKEFRRALRTGSTSSITTRYSDEQLVKMLKNHYHSNNRWIILSCFLLSFFLFQISSRMDIWPIFTLALLLFALTGSFLMHTYASKPEAWTPLAQKLQNANLPPLLDAHALGVSTLTHGIQASISSRLSSTPNDVLESLTPVQRKQLVRFTLKQMQLVWSEPRRAEDKHAQAATLGYLALATLKQPGADRPNRSGMNATHTHLSKAIGEYLLAMRERS